MTLSNVKSPIWLNPPLLHSLPCKVLVGVHPSERTVEVTLDRVYTMIVSADSVTVTEEPTAAKAVDGQIAVTLVAEIPETDAYLAELPAPPVNGSQRVPVEKAAVGSNGAV
jgi:hypothetical protein